MSATEQTKPTTDELQELAKRHLWMHFTRMGAYAEQELRIIVRGEGCHVYDQHDNRYLDGLAALYCVNVGHGRTELAELAAAQIRELAFYTNWSYAHPRSIELAAKIASLTPGDLNRVFFTSGGSESVDSALKLCRQYHKLTGNAGRFKAISRKRAYHGTSLGALTVTGMPGTRQPFEPLFPGSSHVPNTNPYRPEVDDPAEAIRDQILFEGPDSVAAVILEPIQNSGGCLLPPEGYWTRVREICDEFGILLISDEVICAWGRIGDWFGASRLGYLPDIITTAKGLTSAYAPMGAVIASDRVFAPFADEPNAFSHGLTFGGHPVASAVALGNIEIMEREDLNGRVRSHEDEFGAMMNALRDIPLVGDVRGMGYFWALELVKDRATKERFDDAERHLLLDTYVAPELARNGLLCRADDRGEPIVQLAPPLIAGSEEFAQMEAILRPVLENAAQKMNVA